MTKIIRIVIQSYTIPSMYSMSAQIFYYLIYLTNVRINPVLTSTQLLKVFILHQKKCIFSKTILSMQFRYFQHVSLLFKRNGNNIFQCHAILLMHLQQWNFIDTVHLSCYISIWEKAVVSKYFVCFILSSKERQYLCDIILSP